MKFSINALLIAALAAGSFAAPVAEPAAVAAPAEAVEDYIILIDKEKRAEAVEDYIILIDKEKRAEAVEDYIILIDKEKREEGAVTKRSEAVEDYIILIDKEKRHGLHGDKK